LAVDVMTETTQLAILSELRTQAALLNIIAQGHQIDSPETLQWLCATGQINLWFSVGDVIYIPWTDNTGDTPVEYSLPFVVVHIGDVYDQNNTLHHNGLWLMAMYAAPHDMPFDAPESTTVDLTTEVTAQEGWYYWGVAGTTYTALNLNPGDVIPGNYSSVRKSTINNVDVLKSGYNRWSQSAYRQWLNSEAAKDEGWWTEQHTGDVAPSPTIVNLPGWLNGFSSDWRAIFQPVKVETACNTITDGGETDVTYDRFFLPSLEQVYAVPQADGVEGGFWEYWQNETGFDTPYNGSAADSSDARKIPTAANQAGSAVNIRLRSALLGNAHYGWSIRSGGYVDGNSVSAQCYAMPACVIY